MKITSNKVHKIMNLVTVHKEAVPQLLDLLNAIVKVEELDLPLKRNQSFVMQYFMQYRADIAHVIDQDENARYDMDRRLSSLQECLLTYFVLHSALDDRKVWSYQTLYCSFLIRSDTLSAWYNWK